MKILYVCSELFPLLKTGGLADVSAALPAALRAANADVRLLLPAFPAIQNGVDVTGPALALGFAGGPRVAQAAPGQSAPRLLPGRVRVGGQPVYLLDAPALYARPGGPYHDAQGHEWPDNAERFALLGWAAACLALGADPGWRPEVLHAHDWHAGLAPLYARELARTLGARPPASVFTIHNLAYQGLFPAHMLGALGLPGWAFGMDGLEFYGQISFMKAGIQYADAITTVSPRYAREIQTPEQGCGLDGLLRARADRLRGILNGVDYTVWNPAQDPFLAPEFAFDRDRLDGKARAKRALQQALGLQPRADALLFVAVSRLSEQKGLHLLPAVLDTLRARGGQVAVLGSGDAAIEAALQQAFASHGDHAALRLGYDEALAHRLVAGGDVLLMPSRFEPCGLTQLYALRYGTLPLVHEVGGLADTVTDCALENLDDGSASGFVFHSFAAAGLEAAVRRAFALRRRAPEWAAVQRHAMQLRFEWAHAAHHYLELFSRFTHAGSA